jgi:hypothetical protein
MKNATTSITHVTDYAGMLYHIFLVIHEKKGYLASCNGEDKVGYDNLCPCCMFDSHRQAICTAVRSAISQRLIEGRVVWCVSESGANNEFAFGTGKNTAGPYPHLDENLFIPGTFDDVPLELQKEVQARAKTICAERGYPTPSSVGFDREKLPETLRKYVGEYK